ncbi:MAG: hypothetical protein H6576_18515 [Lewinellaceae bacterium]|nr:hypothetical protein [Lewinellaceae bacterium]
MSRYSLFAYLLCCALILASSFLYYTKWQQTNTEATISWDVSGYYLYLPAVIIYKDVKALKWWPHINEKYNPGPGMGQAFKHESGNFVMKYSMGQALQFLPWFMCAHMLAEPLGYPADGFSKPYQAAISWGSLLLAFLGLWVLRRILLRYFSDGIVAAVLISIVFGSNYLEYSAISGAMTHNWLFTLYCLLIYATIRFYENPGFKSAVVIGLLVGWATLTRPTEIISALIPLLWGVYNMQSLRNRIELIKFQWPKYLLAAGVAAVVMFLQALYWKYATGHWVVYSYEDQGFTWLPPHIEDVLWSARAGWLVYSPLMLFAVVGMFMLPKVRKQLFPAVFVYCMIALYITSAWDIWWYGGSLGQRAMVQSYPLWAFGLAAFWQWVSVANWRRWTLIPVAGIAIFINLWWCHQAHKGGMFFPEQMTRAYILKALFHFESDRNWLKLLDTKDYFEGAERQNIRSVFKESFGKDSLLEQLVLTLEKPSSPIYNLPVKPGDARWLRASLEFHCREKEWTVWKMTQFVVRFKSGDKIVKERLIRLQRHVDGSELRTVYFDTKIPNKSFDQVEMFLWRPESEHDVIIESISAETFD